MRASCPPVCSGSLASGLHQLSPSRHLSGASHGVSNLNRMAQSMETKDGPGSWETSDPHWAVGKRDLHAAIGSHVVGWNDGLLSSSPRPVGVQGPRLGKGYSPQLWLCAHRWCCGSQDGVPRVGQTWRGGRVHLPDAEQEAMESQQELSKPVQRRQPGQPEPKGRPRGPGLRCSPRAGPQWRPLLTRPQVPTGGCLASPWTMRSPAAFKLAQRRTRTQGEMTRNYERGLKSACPELQPTPFRDSKTISLSSVIN